MYGGPAAPQKAEHGACSSAGPAGPAEERTACRAESSSAFRTGRHLVDQVCEADQQGWGEFALPGLQLTVEVALAAAKPRVLFAKSLTPGIGQRDADAAPVLGALPATHEAATLERVQDPRRGGWTDAGVLGEVTDARAVVVSQ